MKTLKISGIVLMAVAVFASCKKNDGEPVNQAATVKTATNIMGDTIIGLNSMGIPYGSGKYTFFNLETNSVVANSDSATTKWDLGFRGTTIITNGGNSGPGVGGAFIQTGTFEALTTISADSAFRVDAAPTSYAITTGSGKGWYTYNPLTNLVTPVPGRVIVVRTASGKYAKVEITSYYKNGVTPATTDSDDIKTKNQRYYNFRYAYQANGTKSF